jgi:hypothetical protein
MIFPFCDYAKAAAIRKKLKVGLIFTLFVEKLFLYRYYKKTR